MLINAANPSNVIQRDEAKAAVATVDGVFVPIEVASPENFAHAFRTFVGDHVDVVLIPADAMFFSEREQIAALAIRARLPTVFRWREHVTAGGLVSYGPDLRDGYRRVAFFVDKILTGTKAGDLPVEFPTKLELVINLRTANALGLDVPPTLLARADEVIE
jgi:putative tryptophan/tyrosine transport system substrate-binding protein